MKARRNYRFRNQSDVQKRREKNATWLPRDAGGNHDDIRAFQRLLQFARTRMRSDLQGKQTQSQREKHPTFAGESMWDKSAATPGVFTTS